MGNFGIKIYYKNTSVFLSYPVYGDLNVLNMLYVLRNIMSIMNEGLSKDDFLKRLEEDYEVSVTDDCEATEGIFVDADEEDYENAMFETVMNASIDENGCFIDNANFCEEDNDPSDDDVLIPEELGDCINWEGCGGSLKEVEKFIEIFEELDNGDVIRLANGTRLSVYF